MRTMIIAAGAILSLSAGAAYADQRAVADTELPRVVAGAPVRQIPTVATAQNGQAVYAYVANSGRGTWLFPPNENQGANS